MVLGALLKQLYSDGDIRSKVDDAVHLIFDNKFWLNVTPIPGSTPASYHNRVLAKLKREVAERSNYRDAERLHFIAIEFPRILSTGIDASNLERSLNVLVSEYAESATGVKFQPEGLIPHEDEKTIEKYNDFVAQLRSTKRG